MAQEKKNDPNAELMLSAALKGLFFLVVCPSPHRSEFQFHFTIYSKFFLPLEWLKMNKTGTDGEDHKGDDGRSKK